MCGIAYAHDLTGRPVNNLILDVFDAQRSRGTQGFGLFDGQEKNLVRSTTEDKILKWLCKYDSNLLLFHHRFPTSTKNTKNTAHPFATKNFFGKRQYILVHNGHINNSRELRAKHEALGIKYRSVESDNRFNDSEALLWDFALTQEGRQDNLEAYGNIAFICLLIEDGLIKKMFFGRNSNPLNLYREKGGILLSSEGAGEPIEPDKLYTWHYEAKRLTTKEFKVPQYYSDVHTYQPAESSGSTYDEEEYYQRYTSPLYDEDFWETFNWEEIPEPSAIQVRLEAQALLRENGGLFYDAYMDAEDEYSSLCEYAMTLEDFKRMQLLTRIMEYFDNDPENLDDDSVSSMFLVKPSDSRVEPKQEALMVVGD